MRNTRRLWASIIFVMVLTSASIAGLVSGAITPVLGLDLQGGVAVILSAPDGTPADVMETALENIRRRVDAFGVGEPDIFLSGTTIEIQIPGASDSTIEQRTVDLTCITDDEGTYGCGTPEDVEAALAELEVSSVPSEVCIVTADGTDLECASSAAQAQQAMAGYTVQPETEEEPGASASPTPSEGPAAPADSYCLTDPEGAQPACYDTKADADEALNQLDTEVRSRTYCVTPTLPEPEEDPDPSATPTPTPSASPEPSGAELFTKLDLSSADDLPCNFASEARADAALAALEATHVTSQSCVVSSQGEDLGCFRRLEDAETRRRETGQQRLLDVIGTTARLEQREVLEIVAPGTPQYDGLELTCATEQEQETPRCTGGALDGEEVVYLDPETGGKYRLGPVIISGENIDRALAAFATGGTQSNPTPEWQVSFELDDEGARAFGEATTRLAPTRGQIAIALDREVVSDPAVNDPITNGAGVITGGFTEEQARELATLLNAGSLPVDLTRESVRTVSPTLGEESLQQGIVAALAGLALLMIYLLLYYRMLGVVAWMGMTIWAVLAIGLVAIAGQTFGYALTLAGVAGLVISIGVTADSYIVFFERLKDELRGGRSPRSVVQPAFQRAFRTIVAADIVTALAAIVLYITAASSVRGFALTLGVSVALDLFVVWFFKRPTVFLLSRNRRLAEMRAFGLKAAAAADHEAIDSTGDPA